MNEQEMERGLAPTPGYRYADAVGDQLFVAGQVPIADAEDGVAHKGDPAGQVDLCLDNLIMVIQVNGFRWDDVRRLVVYVVGDQANLTAAWDAVVQYCGGSTPPATLLGVNRLGYPDQLVEIDATVVRNRSTDDR